MLQEKLVRSAKSSADVCIQNFCASLFLFPTTNIEPIDEPKVAAVVLKRFLSSTQ